MGAAFSSPFCPALRVKALESLLVEKGLLNSATVDRWIEVFSEEVGPKNGARVVARAWTDPAFKERLMINATEAIVEMGCPKLEANNLVVVENTPQRHNVVVCTLCSCYPWAVLGVPPTWYKSFEYRARVVRDPRGVLKEFGLKLERRGPGVGQHGRNPLHGTARTSPANRGVQRGGTRRPRIARCDGGHGQGSRPHAAELSDGRRP